MTCNTKKFVVSRNERLIATTLSAFMFCGEMIQLRLNDRSARKKNTQGGTKNYDTLVERNSINRRYINIVYLSLIKKLDTSILQWNLKIFLRDVVSGGWHHALYCDQTKTYSIELSRWMNLFEFLLFF